VTGQPLNWLRRLRAAIGALVILLPTVAATVTLAVNTDDNTCGMACCIADAYCCCGPARSVNSDRPIDDSLGEIETSEPCPAGCANRASTLKVKSRADVRAVINHAHFHSSILLSDRWRNTARRTGVLRLHIPRGPPSSLLFA
jgi:hypothetical protein